MINNAVKSLFKTLVCHGKTFGHTLYPISKVVYAAIHIERDRSAVICNASALKDYRNITVRISGLPCNKVTTIQVTDRYIAFIILCLTRFSNIGIVSIHGGGKQTTFRELITSVVALTWFQYLSVDTSSISLIDPSLPAALNNKHLTGPAFKDSFCCFSMYMLDVNKAWTVLSIA